MAEQPAPLLLCVSMKLMCPILVALAVSAVTVAGASAPSTPANAAAHRSRAPERVARPMVLPFIDDDYAKAVAEARARKIPLFIEAWAPW